MDTACGIQHLVQLFPICPDAVRQTDQDIEIGLDEIDIFRLPPIIGLCISLGALMIL